MWLKLLRWNPPRRSSSRSLRRRNLSRSIKSTAEMSTRNWRSTKQVHSLCLEIWELVFLSFVFSRTRRGFFCRMIFKNAIFDYSGIWKLWPSLNRSARYRRPLPSSSAARHHPRRQWRHRVVTNTRMMLSVLSGGSQRRGLPGAPSRSRLQESSADGGHVRFFWIFISASLSLGKIEL